MLTFSPPSTRTASAGPLPVVFGALCAGAISLLAPGAAHAQGTAQPAPTAWLQALDASAATVQALELAPTGTGGQQTLQFDVELAGTVHTILLQQRDIRRPGYQLLVDDGSSIDVIEAGEPHTYEGSITGAPGSRVAASFRAGVLHAVVRPATGDTLYGIQPAFEIDPAAAPDLYLVHDGHDALLHGHDCGVTHTTANTQPSGSGGEDMLRIAELAVEGDFVLYQQLGSNALQVESTILSIVNFVNVIYERDVEIRHEVSATLIRTGPDPYTTTAAGTLLTQFGNWWNLNQNGVQRDVAHLFTGRNLNGSTIGIADLGEICDISDAYALSQLTFSNNVVSRTGLVAHELGHNWNATHCDATANCRIMCAGLGGCSNNLSAFGPAATAQILAFKNTRTCLSTGAPVLTSLTPTVVEALPAAPVVMTGENLATVQTVTVAGQALPPTQFSVLSATQIQFTPPAPTQLSFESVQVTSPEGTSNPLAIIRTANNPALLEGPPVGIGGLTLMYRCGTQPSRTAFLLGSINSPQILPFGPFQVLSNPVLILSGTSTAGGRFDVNVPTPFGLPSFELRAQMVVLDAQGALIETISNPFLTQFL